MIAVNILFDTEVPDNIKDERSLVRWAKQKNIIPKEKRQKLELKDGEYAVPRVTKSKIKKLNPRTGRMKNKKTTTYLKTTVKPEDRTLKNLPRLANKKPRVRFQDWLMLNKFKRNSSHNRHSIGQSPDGKWYGWSHRAIHGFEVGEIVKPGTIGNKYRSRKNGWGEDEKETFKPYKIKSEEEAKEHAIRFADEVS